MAVWDVFQKQSTTGSTAVRLVSVQKYNLRPVMATYYVAYGVISYRVCLSGICIVTASAGSKAGLWYPLGLHAFPCFKPVTGVVCLLRCQVKRVVALAVQGLVTHHMLIRNG